MKFSLKMKLVSESARNEESPTHRTAASTRRALRTKLSDQYKPAVHRLTAGFKEINVIALSERLIVALLTLFPSS